jgi:methylenetetrahydrofolate--tRNA-(uracil-5-)-methyltransferase
MGAVTIVGGGWPGCEAALQLADRGFRVRLFEMRPETPTGAHKTDKLAEIVCSQFVQVRSSKPRRDFKAEMDALGCRLLPVARENSVPPDTRSASTAIYSRRRRDGGIIRTATYKSSAAGWTRST